MVELYDLNLVTGMRQNEAIPPGTTELDNRWPADMDQHIAQLDFETSSIANEESIFASMAMDPTLISTDSLDMEQLRQRCVSKKNDYKLTFEDSGQWTTSGFGTGTSPSGVAIHLDEDSEEEQRRQSADLLLNNDSEYPNGTFTTWGRIRNVEPPYDPKTNSLVTFRQPNINNVQTQERRPTSLLANFVERQQLSNNPPHDFEYSEQYLGDGRYVDLNENEIGFAPQNTASIQSTTKRPPVPPAAQITPTDRWQTAHKTKNAAPKRRTFANLETNAPDLNFLSLPFKMPSFCRSSTSLDEIFRYTQQNDVASPRISASKTEAFISELMSSNVGTVANAATKLFQTATSPSLTQFTPPDSGLGSSGGCNSIGGPSHIEDWNSLSILLPKHVVDVCSFFKSNSTLLTGEKSNSTANLTSHNSIERKPRSACRTCYGLRSNCLHPPEVFARSQRELCDCSSSSEHPSRKFSSLSVADRKQTYNRRTKLNADELSVIGLPIYNAKRQLVERVVEGAANLARGGTASILYSALESLLSDGLKDGWTLWKAIKSLTTPGKVTGSIHKTVQKLDANEKQLNSRILTFLQELIRSQSLEGYFSYIVLKEKQLNEMYSDTAFLVRAHTSYRSLFWRLIESLELLSVLSQSERPSSTQSTISSQLESPSASRIASDSRIPKSTSEPLRLSTKFGEGSRSLSTCGTFGRRKRSKIPILVSLSQHRSRSMRIR